MKEAFKFKFVSRAERLHNVKYKDMPASCYHKPKNSKVYKDVEVKEGNKVIRDTRLVDYDPIENFEQYNMDMFDLDNLIAIGAVDNLKYSVSSDNRIDGVLSQLDNL